MIHLDTHVVIWIHAGRIDDVPVALRERLGSDDVAVSPMVEVEMAFLHEIGRIGPPEHALGALRRVIGLRTDQTPFDHVSRVAAEEHLALTRDPFDRVIAAQAVVAGADLATKDRTLRAHLDRAVWD